MRDENDLSKFKLQKNPYVYEGIRIYFENCEFITIPSNYIINYILPKEKQKSSFDSGDKSKKTCENDCACNKILLVISGKIKQYKSDTDTLHHGSDYLTRLRSSNDITQIDYIVNQESNLIDVYTVDWKEDEESGHNNNVFQRSLLKEDGNIEITISMNNAKPYQPKLSGRYQLPRWLDNALPELHEPCHIYLKDDTFHVKYPDGNDVRLTKDLEESYDCIDKMRYDITFSDEVWDKYGLFGSELQYFMLAKPDEKESRRMLDSTTDDNRIEGLQEAFRLFLDNYDEWLQAPGDFYRSYKMIDTHPAFWTRESNTNDFEQIKWDRKLYWQWKTDEYC